MGFMTTGILRNRHQPAAAIEVQLIKGITAGASGAGDPVEWDYTYAGFSEDEAADAAENGILGVEEYAKFDFDYAFWHELNASAHDSR